MRLSNKDAKLALWIDPNGSELLYPTKPGGSSDAGTKSVSAATPPVTASPCTASLCSWAAAAIAS